MFIFLFTLENKLSPGDVDAAWEGVTSSQPWLKKRSKKVGGRVETAQNQVGIFSIVSKST